MQARKMAFISTRWLAAVGLATATTQLSAADMLYTYQTSAFNPLYEVNTDNSEPDDFTITLLSPFVLAPDSYYDISVSNSESNISSWSASDSLFGISLTGSNAPISLVTAPGSMAGSVPSQCVAMLSCFGGAIATNAAGQIVQWNLFADGGSDIPFLTFITYNNPFIGTVDALGLTYDSQDALWENRPGGPTGSWNGFTPSPFPPVPGVPEPSTWAMMLLGFAGLAFAGYRRALSTA